MVNWRCLGIDISAKQLDMARSGAEELAVSDRVEYREQPTAAFGRAVQLWVIVPIWMHSSAFSCEKCHVQSGASGQSQGLEDNVLGSFPGYLLPRQAIATPRENITKSCD